MKNRLAPIILFVFNRPYHVKRTIEALEKNELARESKLLIFSDGPRSKFDIRDVSDVRKYIRAIEGFKEVIIEEKTRNLGLSQSVITGVTEMVNRYGKVIVLEDDMITSPFFLEFMNDALNFYENIEEVVSIQGYMYPVEKRLPETFFLRMADCWGWATWERGWDLFEPNGQCLLDELRRKKLECDFDFNSSYGYTQMLEDQIAGRNDSWAIRWYASVFLKERLGLYSGRSLIQNIGMDGTGRHSGVSNNLHISLAHNPVLISDIPLKENRFSRKQIENYFASRGKRFRVHVKEKIKEYFKQIITS